ncbi:hypothetical protein BAU15_05060 [Enterococcus sp. JM4C]|uniref:hypothetical protein n=1 Tax=Candidatus Enterococcus huntleyi TaxID=1857217 RepID=UPI0013796C42|nr:hypothetical protein [Enterococcus sp. JM4C]KAF1295124.1 hypothetical protein BAU15_05060 [Enterococcus sp. JM4C]
MNRKNERILVRIGATWNIINGVITLFFYSPWIRNSALMGMTEQNKGSNFLSENLNTFVMTYGLLFILLGVLNLYLSWRIIDNEVSVKIPAWFVVVGLLSYLVTDAISAIVYIIAGFLCLAKNKAIKLSHS